MSRPTQRQRTQRLPTDPRAGQSPVQLQVDRRYFNAGGYDKNVRAARALENALGTFAQFAQGAAERYGKKQYLLGTQAALEGRELSEEEKRRDAFMVGVSDVKTDRLLIEIRAGMTDLVNNFDKAGGTLEDLKKMQSAYLQDQLKGYDPKNDLDRRMIERMLPELQKLELEGQMLYQKNVQQGLQQEVEGDITLAVGVEIDETGKLDYEALNQRLRPIYGNEVGYDKLVEIVAAEAITRGRPDLIDDMPKVWASNAPTPKTLTKYRAALQNARIQAEAVFQRNKKEAEDEDAAKTKAASEAAQRQIFLLTAQGSTEAAKAAIREAVEAGLLTADEARAAANFNKRYQGDGSVNVSVLGKIRHQIAVDPTEVTQDEIWTAYQNGAFGDPNSMTSMNLAIKYIDDRAKAIAGQSRDPMAKAVRAEVRAIVAPTKIDAIGNFDGASSRRSAAAMRAYDEEIANGSTPEEARGKALETYEKMGGSLDEQTRGSMSPVPTTVAGAATALKGGTMDIPKFKSLVTANAWGGMEVIAALEAAGYTDAEIAEIIRAQ